MKFEKTCPICGKTFSGFKSELEVKKTCSRKCGQEYRRNKTINWGLIASEIAKKNNIKYRNEIETFSAVYPAIYKNQVEWAEVVGVAVNTMGRRLKRIGVTR